MNKKAGSLSGVFTAHVPLSLADKVDQLAARIVPDNRLVDVIADTVSNIISGVPLAARWHKKFTRLLTTGISPVTSEDV